MSAYITSRTLSEIADKRIRMLNSTVLRAHGISSWNSLRIAIRFTFDGNANISGINNNLRIGFQNLTGTQFIGFSHDYNGFAFQAASGGNAAYYNPYVNLDYPTKILNGIYTNGRSAACNFIPPADVTATTRKMIFVDVVKGVPNWTISLFNPNAAPSSTVDVSVDEFLTTATSNAPVFVNHGYTTFTPIAFDEDAGIVDHICIYWSTSAVATWLEISDLAVINMSN